jgi:FkbM family methyltransferase
MSLLQTFARHTSGLVGRESRLIRGLRPAYESLLEWSTNGRGIHWTINGITYRIDPHQRHRLAQNYDAEVAGFLRRNIKPGSLCFDVGANVGVYVLQFAHWSGPTGQVIAFEPNPVARAILEKHVCMNQLTERVRIVPAAVSEASGEQILYAAEADGMSRLGEPNRSLAGKTGEIVVPVLTLDEYCTSEGLQPGARKLIQSRRAQLGIIVEMHPDVWSSANTTRARAEDLLAELGLRAMPLTGQSDPLGNYGMVHLAYA